MPRAAVVGSPTDPRLVRCLLWSHVMSGSAAATPSTIFEVLAREHRDFEARFAQVQQLGAPRLDEARRIYAQLADQLVAHLRAEAEVVYPILAGLRELGDDVAGAVAAHARLVQAVGELRVLRVTAGEWLRAVRRLEADIEHHIDLAEREMFPVARRALSEAEAQALAHAFIDHEHLALAPPAPA